MSTTTSIATMPIRAIKVVSVEESCAIALDKLALTELMSDETLVPTS